MLLTDVWMLDAFLARHPPVDLLAAAYMNWKPLHSSQTEVSRRDARKANSEALASLPPRRKTKTLAQMPAFLRSPDQLAMIEKVQAEWQTNSE